MNVRDPGSNPGDRSTDFSSTYQKWKKNNSYPISGIYSQQLQLLRTTLTPQHHSELLAYIMGWWSVLAFKLYTKVCHNDIHKDEKNNKYSSPWISNE